MSIKRFLSSWKPKNLKEMGKDGRTNLLWEELPAIVDFYIKKAHTQKAQEEVKELFERMNDEKFAKTLRRISKTNDVTPVDLGMAIVINGFLERNRDNVDEDLIARYIKLIDKILEERLKDVNKKLGLSDDLVKELLVVIPEPELITDPRFVGIYVSRVLRKLYALVKDNELGLEDIKTVKKLFKKLFGKDMINYVAVNVLLERKDFIRNFNDNQKALWNLMTNFALDVLESNKKKELREYIEFYVSKRAKDAQNQRDSARRLQFAQISEEDYPRLHEVAADLAEKEKYAQFL